jgi:TetR/AcrR family transcriptional regulator, transcriptional repressor for nem operon
MGRVTTTTRDNLLHAATRLMLERGYNGTTVDEICSAAGTTKGAFFHHFKNKDDLGLATLDRYAERIFEVMKQGANKRPHDAVGRVYDYVEALGRMSHAKEKRPACMLAIETMELGAVHEEFRKRCEQHFETWATYLEELLERAIATLPHPIAPTPRELADQLIVVFEGSVLLARAQSDAAIVERNLDHYRRYLEMTLATPR